MNKRNDINGTEVKVGSVVRWADRKGARRLFVVTNFDCTDCVYMRALSGGFRGSGPSGHHADRLLVVDAPVQFSGANARALFAAYSRAIAR